MDKKVLLIKKLREPTTWRGLAVIAGMMGYTLTPDQAENIVGMVVMAIGIIDIVTDEGKAK